MLKYRVDAFTKGGEGGNPAGVVLDGEKVSPSQRQAMASELGFSETVFVEKLSESRFSLAFYTPTDEIDLCGHATVGAFGVMKALGLLEAGRYMALTRAGELPVEIAPTGQVMMRQNAPRFYETVPKALIAESLGLSADDLSPDLPCEVVSTGVKDILVPVAVPLNKIKPDFKAIEDVSRRYKVTGYHVFSRVLKDRVLAQCRNFAPLFGIPEEAATGTSNGALLGYLHRHGCLRGTFDDGGCFIQGMEMKRPSKIVGRLDCNGGRLTGVYIGGEVANIERL